MADVFQLLLPSPLEATTAYDRSFVLLGRQVPQVLGTFLGTQIVDQVQA